RLVRGSRGVEKPRGRWSAQRELRGPTRAGCLG
ncbi:MAG: hypothetical protein QG603_213, partial [Patescibacteria group bacterium]|nr:hypothetical protein [Patescibacteria group bacterium]